MYVGYFMITFFSLFFVYFSCDLRWSEAECQNDGIFILIFVVIRRRRKQFQWWRFFSSLLSIFLVVLQWNSMNDFVVSEKENKNHNRAVIILSSIFLFVNRFPTKISLKQSTIGTSRMERRGMEMKKNKANRKWWQGRIKWCFMYFFLTMCCY